MIGRCRLLVTTALALSVAAPAMAQDATGLLFRASADKSLTADVAVGDPVPNFRSGVDVVPDGAIGGAARWQDDGYVAWKAPGNIRAERGTLSFFWRSRTPVGEAIVSRSSGQALIRHGARWIRDGEIPVLAFMMRGTH